MSEPNDIWTDEQWDGSPQAEARADADTAPEGERQVIDTPQRCGVCSHRWTHCQCNPQRTAPERA